MIPLLRKDDLAMLSTESFLELLRLLPDDKRNKLLSNSKLKQYSIDGYRNLKYAPLKVLSAHAVKSHLFCETFLSLVVDEYNCLTPKDAQTFSIEEYPGILAYYLKCGLDVAPIEKRYNELIRETENETVLNPIEEQVKHNMIMKKYLGYVLKQNLYYYNFYPVFTVDNEITKIESPATEFPQKGNINLSSQLYAQHKCSDVFRANQVALIEFSEEDLSENRRGDQLNQTERKLDVDDLYNRNRIHRLKDIDLFPVVHLATKLDFSGSANLILEDNIQNSEDVFVEEEGLLYGPYKVDANHQIKVLKSSNGTIQCWRPKMSKTLDECCLRFDIDIGKYVLRSNLEMFYRDVLSEEELLQSFVRTLKDKRDLNSPEAVVANYMSSVFVGLDSNIAEERKKKISNFIENSKNESHYSKEIASAVAGLFAEYGDDDDLRSVLENALDDPEFSSKIQSLDIVRDKVKREQDKLSKLEKEIEEAQKGLEDTEKQRKSESENKEQRDKIKALELQLDKHKTVENLDFEIQFRERTKEELNKKIEAAERKYKDVERKLENAITEKVQSVQSLNGITDIAFDGVLTEKMLQAASTWRHENASDDYKKITEITTSDSWSKDKLNVVDYVVSNVKFYRPSYTRNEIINISVCVAQNFLTVFSGEPGTGKTSICNIFAHILGLTLPEVTMDQSVKKEYYTGRYVPVSVERGWTSKRDFIGYYNPLSKEFESANKQLCDGLRILNQEGDSSKYPFIILLDEANLSPVEYYWADFMNACDSDSATKYLELGKGFELKVPQTLRFVATINNDHTTEILSPRLLDRAFIISLPSVTVDTDFVEVDFSSVPSQTITWKQFVDAFGCTNPVVFSDKIAELYKKLYNAFCSLNIRISPRTEKAIRLYWSVSQNLFDSAMDGTDPSIVALDYAFAQKMLPKINGSGDDYGNSLKTLEQLFNANHFEKCATKVKEIYERGKISMNYYQYF